MIFSTKTTLVKLRHSLSLHSYCKKKYFVTDHLWRLFKTLACVWNLLRFHHQLSLRPLCDWGDLTCNIQHEACTYIRTWMFEKTFWLSYLGRLGDFPLYRRLNATTIGRRGNRTGKYESWQVPSRLGTWTGSRHKVHTTTTQRRLLYNPKVVGSTGTHSWSQTSV